VSGNFFARAAFGGAEKSKSKSCVVTVVTYSGCGLYGGLSGAFEEPFTGRKTTHFGPKMPN
jgi:hypothetical protein